MWAKITLFVVLFSLLLFGIWWIASTSFYSDAPTPTLEQIEDIPAHEIQDNTSVIDNDNQLDREPIKTATDSKSWIGITGKVINGAIPGTTLKEEPAKAIPVGCRWGKPGPLKGLIDKTITNTDAKGNFHISFEDPGYRPISVSLNVRFDDQYRTAWIRNSIPEGNYGLDGLTIYREGYGILEGVTVDGNNNPLPGVRISFPQQGTNKITPVAVSDNQGKFRLDGVQVVRPPNVSLDGYVLFEMSRLEKCEEGGWNPMRIIMVPEGTLEVRVQDSNGKGIPGRRIIVKISESELRSYPGGKGWSSTRRLGRTDQLGVAKIDGLCSGKELCVTVRSGTNDRRALQMDSGWLIFDEQKGETIVIRDGLLVVTAYEASSLLFKGKVFFSNGQPVPKPNMTVTDPSEKTWDRKRLRVRAAGDLDGQFKIWIPGGLGHNRLKVVATDKRNSFKNAVPVIIETGEAVAGVLEMKLVLEPTLCITGHIKYRDGKPVVQSDVRAVPVDFKYAHAPTIFGETAVAHTNSKGGFRVTSLAPGYYNLYVAYQRLHFGPGYYHRFPDIRAGSKMLDLVLPDRKLVKIRIHAQVAGKNVSHYYVHIGRYLPRDEIHKSFSSPRTISVNRLCNWPNEMPLDYLITSGENEQGAYSFGFRKGSELKEGLIPKIDQGWYIIGVEAFDEVKNPYFPMATELLYFEEGEYNIYFNFVPTSIVKGRVLLKKKHDHLYMLLREKSGNIVLIVGKTNRPASTISINGDGSFLIKQAPIGKFILCVGMNGELQDGYSLIEQEIQIDAGENPFLVIKEE